MSDCFDHELDAMEDAYLDDGRSTEYLYSNRYSRRVHKQKRLITRVCTKCDRGFSSYFPQACPECGGWSKEV